jgi:hypothetical protein
MDYIRRKGHNPPRGPSVGWWVLTTANAAGTNSLTRLQTPGGARGNTFLNRIYLVNLKTNPRLPNRTGLAWWVMARSPCR